MAPGAVENGAAKTAVSRESSPNSSKPAEEVSDFIPLKDPVLDLSHLEDFVPSYMPSISSKRNRDPVGDRGVEKMYEKKSEMNSGSKIDDLLNKKEALENCPKPPDKKVHNTRSRVKAQANPGQGK